MLALIPASASADDRAALNPTALRLECTSRLIRAQSLSGCARIAVRPSSPRIKAKASPSDESSVASKA